MYTENDYRLYHHGILGMKWGKLNGPPYPLGSGDHSTSEKKAGWRKSLGGGRNEELYSDGPKKEKHGLSDKQKKAIKIGLTAAGVALAAYGGYKLYKSGALDDLIKRGKESADLIKSGNADGFEPESFKPETFKPESFKPEISERIRDISEKTGLKLKETTNTISEDAGIANPMSYDRNKSEWKNNCSHASMAYILRRIGLDVEAKPMKYDEEGGLMFSELGHYFKNIGSQKATISVPKTANIDDIKKHVSDQIIKQCNGGDSGACGLFEIRIGDAGHFLAWENVDGVINFVDPQTHSASADSYFSGIIKGVVKSSIEAARFDNLELRANNLSEIVQNRR